MLNIISISIIFSIVMQLNAEECKPSITTASGLNAPDKICSGQLIFEENFEKLDKKKWVPEVTLWGGGNNEFQWYVADDENSFAKDNKLYIRPSLTASKFGYAAIERNHVRLDDCTDPDTANCERKAGGNTIINPVRSARLTTKKSFSFKYGHVEVIAKIPQGDWLWPAIWLLPTQSKYGVWPRSGEIDLLESRGNIKYGDAEQIGVERIVSTLHFGPNWDQDGYPTSGFSKNNESGYHNDFHKFEFIWNENGFKFLLDDTETGTIPVGDGFWQRGAFKGENIWASASKMAPFDQEFHFIVNLAVGGYFFPDLPNKNGKRPWGNDPGTAMKDFWTNRSLWLPTWRNREKSSLVVDSVKVWAI